MLTLLQRMKNSHVLSPFLLLFFVTTQAQTVTAPTGSLVNQQEAQAALDVHNKARKEVNVAPLSWSADLAAFAQAWADHLAANGCTMKHRPTVGTWAQQYGENIYWAQGRSLLAADASRSWYTEIEHYQHGPYEGASRGVGHYTQMVWQATKTLGMGKASCKDGAVIIVANYDPRGNTVGVRPY